MLTKVILDGEMGKIFGRRWELSIGSPGEALRLIDANRPGLMGWIKNNLSKYENYKVTVKYKNGNSEDLDNDSIELEREMSEIRFTPLISGAGGNGMNIAKIVLGIVLIVVAIFVPPLAAYAGAMIGAGIGLAVSGIAGLLTPMPKANNDMATARKDKTSYFFDGPVNTSMQGVPVQPVYGRCLIGSHAISVNLSVDEAVV